MSHHLVRALIEEHGAVPLCPVDHRVDYLVTAPIRGSKDPSKYGHEWVRNGLPIYCIHQVLPTEAEEEEVA